MKILRRSKLKKIKGEGRPPMMKKANRNLKVFISPMSTTRSKGTRAFFGRFLNTTDKWETNSNFSEIPEEIPGLDRYTSIEQTPLKRKSHKNSNVVKENMLKNPLHRPPPRFSRDTEAQRQPLTENEKLGVEKSNRHESIDENGWSQPSVPIRKGWKNRREMRVKEKFTQQKSILKEPNRTLGNQLSKRKGPDHQHIKMMRETSILSSPSKRSLSRTKKGSAASDSTDLAPTPYVYTFTSSDDTVTTYDDTITFDGSAFNSVLTLDKKCDDFHEEVMAKIVKGQTNCTTMIGDAEEELEYIVETTAKKMDGKMNKACLKGINPRTCTRRGADSGSLYDNIPSWMLEIAKKKSFEMMKSDRSDASVLQKSQSSGQSLIKIGSVAYESHSPIKNSWGKGIK